jgi:hypothetical protein
MKPKILCAIVLVLIILSVPAVEWATCGGGGGGGTGGMSTGGPTGPGPAGNSGPTVQVYMVPWKMLRPEDPKISSGMILY